LKLSDQSLSVSVVIPLFNKEKEVLRSVNSVLKQTTSNFEVIVVNDGSYDKGPEIVRAIKDPRIKVINQTNLGVSAARNRGIDEAYADLIAFLDADDEWEPDFIETVINLKDKFPSCDVFATNYIFRRKNNYKRNTVIRGLSGDFKEGILNDYFKIASQSDPPVWSSAVAVTKKALQSVGRFPVGLTSGEDLLTWARLAAKYKIAYSLEPKAYFCEPEILSDNPRIPAIPDIVGEQLKFLLQKNKNSQLDKGLKEYSALWHRMRANIFIRLKQKREARNEIFKALSYSKSTIKLYLFFLLTMLPASAAKQVFNFLKLFQETKLRQSNRN